MEHKSTSIELLKFIGQNARMGTITLSELDKHLPEGDMKRAVRKQLDEYEKVVSASDAKLAKATKWVGAVFVVLTLVLNCMVAAGL